MDPGGSPTQSSNSNDAFPQSTADVSPALDVSDDQNECPSLASGSGRATSAHAVESESSTARGLFSSFLSKIHVVDMLPERSTVCTFDASIPIYEMICALVAVNCKPPEWMPKKTEETEKHTIYPVAANLASNILAEICHFSDEMRCNREVEGTDSQPEADTEGVSQHRSHAGSTDGWGSQGQVEGETMGWLQMPLTVTELSEFLSYSSTAMDESLDWGLARWRKFKEESDSSGQVLVRHGSLLTELPSPSDASDDGIRSPLGTLVQRAGSAPPRPMLRIDEPESTFLRAVELLLCHPELNALPVVSMSQRTVVAHLTLAECLALLVQHFRGKAVSSLGELRLPDKVEIFVSWQERKRALAAGEEPNGECVVLYADDLLLDLLKFFAQTNYTAAPVVTEGNVLIGVLGRQNLLQFLGLCMESCLHTRRANTDKDTEDDKPDKEKEKLTTPEASRPSEEVFFDISMTLREVITTLESYSFRTDEKKTFFGAGTTTESLPLKTLMCDILLSDNHKLVVVEMGEDGAILRRMIHVDELLKLVLYGDSAARKELMLSEV